MDPDSLRSCSDSPESDDLHPFFFFIDFITVFIAFITFLIGFSAETAFMDDFATIVEAGEAEQQQNNTGLNANTEHTMDSLCN